jgi:hypothetical protein
MRDNFVEGGGGVIVLVSSDDEDVVVPVSTSRSLKRPRAPPDDKLDAASAPSRFPNRGGLKLLPPPPPPPPPPRESPFPQPAADTLPPKKKPRVPSQGLSSKKSDLASFVPRAPRTATADPSHLPSAAASPLAACWVDAFEPRCSAEVALFPGKMTAIRDFIARALAARGAAVDAMAHRQQRESGAVGEASIDLDDDAAMTAFLDNCDENGAYVGASQGAMAKPPAEAPLPTAPRVLFLIGPPGTGKSTAVRCLAREAGAVVVEPEMGESDAGGFSGRRWGASKRGAEALDGDDNDDARRAGEALDDTLYRLASSSARSSAAARGDDDATPDLPHASERTRGARGDLETFCALLATSARSRALPLTADGACDRRGGLGERPCAQRVLLFEDVPRCPQATPAAATAWRRIVGDALSAFARCPLAPPAVIVVSASGDGADAATLPALEKLVGAGLARSDRVRVIEVDRCADGRLGKALARVVAAARAGPVRAGLIEGVVASSRGDVRAAVNALEFACAHAGAGGAAGERRARRGDAPSNAPPPRLRDDYFDSLHTLGKLLACKRAGGASAPSDIAAPLAFDVDALAAAATLDSRALLAFLAENAPPRFTDIRELARAMDAFSATDVILSSGGDVGGSGGKFEVCAAAVAARAIAAANATPAPSSFRPTRRPSAGAVERVASANASWLRKGDALGLGDLHGERALALFVVPAIGAALVAPSVDRAWKESFTPRARSLLIAAATSYGPSGFVTSRNGDPASLIGDMPSAEAAEELTAGLQIGMWELTAIQSGVDLRADRDLLAAGSRAQRIDRNATAIEVAEEIQDDSE